MTTVLLAGGGTAGHTSPLLATADALRRIDPSVSIVCVGTERGVETRLVPEAGYRLELVPSIPLPRTVSFATFTLPFRAIGAVRAAERLLARVKPDVVVGYGGYVSVPVYVAAGSRGVPVVVHEQNALPGLGNKLGARIAKVVATSFAGTNLPKTQVVGLPLRAMIRGVDRSSGDFAALQREARAFFGLDADRPTLVVTGGSQGARRLNEAMFAAAQSLSDAGVQVLHVVGPKNLDDVHSTGVVTADGAPYVVVGYVDRMDYALAAADLMICRGGASSVAEAAATGTPAIFVPLPIGNGEQTRNAARVVDAGGGAQVPDHAFDGSWIVRNIIPLITDPARLGAMSLAARTLVPRDADERLARLILEVAK